MKLKLVKKVEEAKGTKSFFFEPEKNISWLPGQYYYYTLPELTHEDTRGPTRHFTISSSPTEGNILRLTTRIREQSGYKKSLDELKIGQFIEGEGPSGTYILDEAEIGKNHLFLAGGIGITPFRCFIKYSLDKKLNHNMFLIYSNSLPEEIVFKDEIEKWEEEGNIKSALTVTKPEESKSKWSGLKGRVDNNMISKQIENWKLELRNSMFWLVGPPPFIDAMESELDILKVPSDNIRSEKFTGY